MNATEFHVTAIRNASVYGHATSHCDASGCSGDELYLGDTREVRAEVGDLVELEFGENASLSRQAARDRGEKMAE